MLELVVALGAFGNAWSALPPQPLNALRNVHQMAQPQTYADREVTRRLSSRRWEASGNGLQVPSPAEQ